MLGKRWLLPGIIRGGLQGDLTRVLLGNPFDTHCVVRNGWAFLVLCLSVLRLGAIPLITCLISKVGKLFIKHRIINILDFADHRSLFQLLDFAVVVEKQLETICK